MTEFTAQLEHAFGVAPSGETGLLIDTFDGAGVGVGGHVRWTTTRAEVVGSICRSSATGATRFSICSTRPAGQA
ncbi:hypothetical protein ACFOWZ_25690 [Lentzea rhizosphaerae]|uniref:Uncharacterized protein n=1 Tax=Lentzea rhizosphaerae TaxID=2041025 RepID=A0ABV8BYV7_9PSEU